MFARVTLCAALIALASTASAAPTRLDGKDVKPLLSSENADRINGHYLVVLRDDVQETHVADHHNWLSTVVGMRNDASLQASNRVKHVYDFHGLKGYAGQFEPEVIDAIRRSEHVAYVEQDQVVRAWDMQTDAPWGLSRISHTKRPDQQHYTEYPFASTAGDNVTVYVVDTGININHVDFEGRASWGATIPENDEDVDGNGHGTHCAGTIAGKKWGVAKKAHVVAVKVLASSGSGTMSDVVRGVEFVITAHKQRGKGAKSAANMSLGGGRSRTLDKAVNAAVDAGVHFAVAAGNDNRDACNYSPAAAEKAITVGATTVEDRKAWFSNHGKCLDVHAPGHEITSAWIGSNTATNTISGTSMASPHVAGLLAYVLSQHPEPLTTKQLKDLIIKMSTKNAIKGLPKKGDSDLPKWPFPWPPALGGGSAGKKKESETPNRLIFTGFKPAKDGDDDETPETSMALPHRRPHHDRPHRGERPHHRPHHGRKQRPENPPPKVMDFDDEVDAENDDMEMPVELWGWVVNTVRRARWTSLFE